MLAECDANTDILCLVDCQEGLTKLDRWIGFGRQATLAQDPNADIMRAILERLHERVRMAISLATEAPGSALSFFFSPWMYVCVIGEI